ncbi:MAG: hypothetical protein QXZ25_03905 [Candidatus Bathyarchaeia archaeon]
MFELDFIAEMVEEQLVKGNLRWLANFNEIHRTYTVGDITFPIYASGSLQERGFFLSKIFSALVTPKYKIHFLLYTSPEIDPKFLRRIILSCKNNFGAEDWVFLSLVQSQPFGKTLKESIMDTTDKTIGIAAYSLASKETISSDNVLGKGLKKQLKLTEARFEALDVPNYVKSFFIVFCLGMFLLIAIALGGIPQATSPLTLLLMTAFSIPIGHRIYKTRYHTTLVLNSKGFQLQEGKTIKKEGKWSDYSDVTIYITPRRETCIRLHAKEGTLDLPISRVGLSRKEVYSAIKQLIKKK